jgi:signal transduction histidine kinase
VSAAERQKRVLVLYGTRRDAQIVVVGDREISTKLEQSVRGGIDYYSEFLDEARFARPEYRVTFRDFLRSKYAGLEFDLLVAMGDAPLDFLAGGRDELFPNTPLVFYYGRKLAFPPANATGISTELELGGTIDLALALQPDLKNVFVICGKEEATGYLVNIARAQFPKYEPRLKITYLAGLPTVELEARLRSLPPHSMVYYLVVDRDGANENFHPLDYLDRISAVSSAPVYSWVDSTMGHGVVGGSLKRQVVQAREVAELAARVLNGEAAEDIPVTAPDLNVLEVDWRALQRWTLSESRLPPGTIVSFKNPSAWDRYKWYVIAAAAVLLAQTLLILALLLERRQRRRAELRARDLGGRLLHEQENERARIARELHDDISQQLALLQLDLKLLRLEGPAADMAADLSRIVDDVAHSVHDLSHRLHPARLRLIGLVGALNGLQRESARSDMAVLFIHDDVPASIPPDLALALYRVVQEALQNAAKYSQAREVRVSLRGAPGRLSLSIEDNGVGFDVREGFGKGLGLISMRERLDQFAGSVDIQSAPGAGTRVLVDVPLTVNTVAMPA